MRSLSKPRVGVRQSRIHKEGLCCRGSQLPASQTSGPTKAASPIRHPQLVSKHLSLLDQLRDASQRILLKLLSCPCGLCRAKEVATSPMATDIKQSDNQNGTYSPSIASAASNIHVQGAS